MNNLNKKYLQIALDVSSNINSLSSNKYTILVGSVADQIVDKYSDIDIIVFYTKEPTEIELAKALNIKEAKKFWLDDTKFHIHLKSENIDTTTLFISLEHIKQLMAKMPNLSLSEFGILSKYIGEGKLLHGDSKIFNAWKRKYKTIPKKIKEDTIYNKISSLNFWFRQGNLNTLIERSDWLMIRHTINNAVEYILTIVYLLNNKIYLNSKRANIIIDGFKIKPNNIIKRVEGLSLFKNTKKDVKNKIEEVKSIMNDLETLIK